MKKAAWLNPDSKDTRAGEIQPGLHVMANFFDHRARVAAAAAAAAVATGGPSSRAAPREESSNVQPWVEK